MWYICDAKDIMKVLIQGDKVNLAVYVISNILRIQKRMNQVKGKRREGSDREPTGATLKLGMEEF